MTDDDELKALHERAYAAMDRGSLAEASQDFGALLLREPDNRYYHYMRGLASKYLLEWPASLQHNLRAIELAEEFGEAEHWNAAIAATALSDWKRVRALWSACGIQVPEGSGAIEGDYGVAVVRLNPWHGGETVFMRRIDPVRARLLNVPLPESGHRFGDIVLHDGAPTGHRHDGEREVPVFNELVRIAPSDFQTFVVFLRCNGPEALRPLLEATAPGIGYVEDWTQTVHHYCMRCSYGTPHRHQAGTGKSWQPHRNLGIAAQSRHSVEKLLRDWDSTGAARDVEGIETREVAIPLREDGWVWWSGPVDEGAPAPESATDPSTADT
ncbi:tetratricopeptide repeat protein [Luteimonas sp. RD2P54]|uniref:Tetratricopeptide repeat protein n=1 Tax=Luteimonas endophytica TaxID=3042023 RepID=A0ABT6J9Q0_9GAMM|nr:tetratricopeptide repeat protein [Luteimonas endophytica]MDH5823556.1 tetratricopeptide repeat protein [Luteimonas endophytica]